jgi:hypothetical protein
MTRYWFWHQHNRHLSGLGLGGEGDWVVSATEVVHSCGAKASVLLYHLKDSFTRCETSEGEWRDPQGRQNRTTSTEHPGQDATKTGCALASGCPYSRTMPPVPASKALYAQRLKRASSNRRLLYRATWVVSGGQSVCVGAACRLSVRISWR